MPAERLTMCKIREVFRLKFDCELSNRKIAKSCHIELQTNEARDAINQAIIDGAEAHKVGEQYEMKWPAVMAVARKS
ncbi:MAG: hypothetical protein ACYSR9_04045 [Planctomycetota bacterium]|jgi:hypothetical protein